MTCMTPVWNTISAAKIQPRIRLLIHQELKAPEETRPVLRMNWKMVTVDSGRRRLRLNWREQ
jgi:hypothetical protein